MTLSLPLKRDTQPLRRLIPRQTILVQKPRTLNNLGLGHKNSLYSINASQELLFSRHIGVCVEPNEEMTDYYNFRALSPIKETYSGDKRVLVECLTRHNGFDELPFLSTHDATRRRLTNCKIVFPPNSSVDNGRFTTTNKGCTDARIEFDCFTDTFVVEPDGNSPRGDTIPGQSRLHIQTKFRRQST